RLPAMVFGSPLAGVTRLVLCMVLGLATAMTLALATGVRQRMEKRAARVVEEENETEEDDLDHDHGSAWIGMGVQAPPSLKGPHDPRRHGCTRAHTGNAYRAAGAELRWPRTRPLRDRAGEWRRGPDSPPPRCAACSSAALRQRLHASLAQSACRTACWRAHHP